MRPVVPTPPRLMEVFDDERPGSAPGRRDAGRRAGRAAADNYDVVSPQHGQGAPAGTDRAQTVRPNSAKLFLDGQFTIGSRRIVGEGGAVGVVGGPGLFRSPAADPRSQRNQLGRPQQLQARLAVQIGVDAQHVEAGNSTRAKCRQIGLVRAGPRVEMRLAQNRVAREVDHRLCRQVRLPRAGHVAGLVLGGEESRRRRPACRPSANTRRPAGGTASSSWRVARKILALGHDAAAVLHWPANDHTGETLRAGNERSEARRPAAGRPPRGSSHRRRLSPARPAVRRD